VKSENAAELLTTGKAARLCSVRPDTILKWIKRGRLEAVRTVGGHYRIEPQDIAPLIRKDARPEGVAPPPPECNPQPMRCWEYLSSHGEIRGECKHCVVYQVRAAWCFQVAGLEQDIGHAKHFCRTSCQECAYYRRVRGLATNVLVVTADHSLVYRLKGDPQRDLSLRFVSNSYEASAVIQAFRPGFVILDRDNQAIDEVEMVRCLATDPRLPGVKVMLAVSPTRPGKRVGGQYRDIVAGVLQKPFASRRISEVIDGLPVEVVSNA
jgi:excisionase family DNA binding protein